MSQHLSSSRMPASPSDASTHQFQPNLAVRYGLDRLFRWATWVAAFVGVVFLAILVVDVLIDGLPRLNWQFLTSFPSRKPAAAGLLSSLVGTLWLLATVALVAFPIGVGAGIFLEEFAAQSKFAQIVEINIANLAGVPSIIYGLLGLQVFVRWMQPITGGRSVLAGGLTLALLVLPIIIVATRESLRTVPDSVRLAGYALGATKWQTIREHVLPAAFAGILTGTILALSRAIGETAPLVTIGAMTFVSYLPNGFQSSFTALPIQVYNWISRPQADFHVNAAAAIIVLLVVLLTMNAAAVMIRNRFQQNRV
jgi:phosphate transport system permease protein